MTKYRIYKRKIHIHCTHQGNMLFPTFFTFTALSKNKQFAKRRPVQLYDDNFNVTISTIPEASNDRESIKIRSDHKVEVVLFSSCRGPISSLINKKADESDIAMPSLPVVNGHVQYSALHVVQIGIPCIYSIQYWFSIERRENVVSTTCGWRRRIYTSRNNTYRGKSKTNPNIFLN